MSLSLEGLVTLSAVEHCILTLNILIYYFEILKIFTGVLKNH